MYNMKSSSEEGGQKALHAPMGLRYDDGRQFTLSCFRNTSLHAAVHTNRADS